MSSATGWSATRALSRGLGVGSLAAAAGLWWGRPDVSVAGGALVLAVAMAVGHGPPRVRAGLRAAAPAAAESGDTVVLAVTATTPAGSELLAVRLPRTGGRSGDAVLVTAAGRDVTRLDRSYPVAGWGSLRLARPDWAVAGADGLYVCGPVQAGELRLSLIPALGAGGAVAIGPRPSGQLGSHRARSHGDGSEVGGVREYRPGDLLRRIDWRVSNRRLASRHPAVRQASLYVRTTVAETDSRVLLLVDTRLDIAPRMADWDLDLIRRDPGAQRFGTARRLRRTLLRRLTGPRRAADGPGTPAMPPASPSAAPPEQVLRPTSAAVGGSLDATVKAAVAVAADHVRSGDRVALIDLGRPRASLAAGSGRRQLDRVRHRLGQVAVDKLGVWRPGSLGPSVAPLLDRAPAGAVAVVVSAFYDAEIVDLTISLARSGRQVVAVDTAPSQITGDPRVSHSGEALALLSAERAHRMERLAAAGVVLRSASGTAEPARHGAPRPGYGRQHVRLGATGRRP